MRLSNLHTGDSCVVVKVLGHGGFRKRIVEMGFIKGKVVEVLEAAPLRDPIKYRIMGYELSLRRDEAELIEVVAGTTQDSSPNLVELLGDDETPTLVRQRMKDEAKRKRRIINVALVGNPNCGKTSLFNFASGAHEHVGNYSGVTVDAKEGHASFEGYEFNIVDLPGTYSLTAYSPEEVYVRRQILDKTPDVIINVLDASNIERNLYLTTQLIDMNLRMVCALNMYDEMKTRGDQLDIDKLATLLGVPIIPTVFKSGEGVKTLFHVIINLYEGGDFLDEHGNLPAEVADDIKKWHDNETSHGHNADHAEDFASGSRPHNNVARHIHVNHGQYVESAIDSLKAVIQKEQGLRARYSTRYLAIKLLENDKNAEEVIRQTATADAILAARDKAAATILEDTESDSETAIMDAKYGFISGALKEAGYVAGNGQGAYALTRRFDRIATHPILGLPIFFLVIFGMFETTFAVGQYPMDWIDAAVNMFSQWISGLLPDGPVRDMIVDGAIAGVGAVIVFLPQILILYLFISFMEDTGYMARAAFIMDKIMHKIGLHGKSFIPFVMAFGCNVPAVMGTRTIESRRSRLVTMLVVPLMSCSARLPVYVMIVGIFFSSSYQGLALLGLYATGIILAGIMSLIFCKFIVGAEDTPFVMELPPYRLPTAKATFRHTWEKGRQYLKKMGGIILVASITVWALGYFPHDDSLSAAEQQEQSIIGRIGKFVEPVFRPLGFSWKQDVSIIAGVGAKEIVASTLGVLYVGDNDAEATDAESSADDSGKYDAMRQMMISDGVTPRSACAYLLFILIYFPCIATLAAIRGETGSWRWAAFVAVYTSVLAWLVAALFMAFTGGLA
ncbi:MAG: ferrous iron transport protein B [Bacteroidales bacterium]|nr:ferrous iron transport protein B [Bacteroidales bacterium]